MKEPATTVDVRELAAALSGALPRLDATDQSTAIATYRLLGRGRPASIPEVAGAAGVRPDEATQRVGEWPAVFFDDDGRIVGFWGLTISAMPPHEIEVSGVKLWAWCAWDTLFLPAPLAAPLLVRSRCPVTKATIELTVAPDRVEKVSPDSVVFSFLSPEARFDGNVITSFCHFVHFFASRTAGEQWVESHLGTFLLSREDAVDLARLTNLSFRDVIS